MAAAPAWRRRHHHPPNLRRYLVPAVTAFSAATLLLLALVSFLTPHPLDPRPPPFLMRDEINNGRKNLLAADVFRIPGRGGSAGKNLWKSSSSKFFYGCSNSSKKFANAETVTYPNRYLMISTSGGLNQQRTGITDGLVAARILNATLVVPKLDQKSFWKDTSDFHEIFDVDWFISFLSNDVKIVRQLPKKGGKIIRMRVPRKCTPKCYQTRVLPVLMKKHVVQLTKFDYRLANRLDTELQKLRCRVNYHALKFTDPILKMGKKLSERMRKKSSHFIALHLRFEPDMLAFSGCYYGGGDKERKELGAIRRRWKTLHVSNPDKERRHGKCPLTPEEVGLMLRALGFGSDVHIYVASGEVYGGDKTLAPLRELFPNFHSKETLASKEELEPFTSFSSRMAALDFIVCDESDVFVTNNNGNMAKILAGRRRYFGHKRTIRPNARKLYSMFLNRANMTWEAFASKVRTNQRGFMGEPKEVRPGRGEFHENPSTCICEIERGVSAGSNLKHEKIDVNNGEDTVDDLLLDEEPDWSEPDYPDNQLFGQGNLSNETESDYEPFSNSQEIELDEMLSD